MTRQLTADVAVPSQCYLAEGPVWDPVARLLRWVDINPGHVHAFDPASGAHGRFAAAGPDGPAVPRDDAVPVGAVGLTRSGGLVLALVDGFALGPAPLGPALAPLRTAQAAVTRSPASTGSASTRP